MISSRLGLGLGLGLASGLGLRSGLEQLAPAGAPGGGQAREAAVTRRGGDAALEVDPHEEVLRDEHAPLPPEGLDVHRVDGRGQRVEHLRDGGACGAVDAQDDVARLQRALPLGGATWLGLGLGLGLG